MKSIRLKIALFVLISGIPFGTFSQGFSSGNNVIPSGIQGGYGGSQGVSSVARAKNLHDDAWVVLEGHIVRQTGHERYEFRDPSGSVTVEIDDEDWQGLEVSSADRVRIEGEIDKGFGTYKVDVKRLHMLTPIAK